MKYLYALLISLSLNSCENPVYPLEGSFRYSEKVGNKEYTEEMIFTKGSKHMLFNVYYLGRSTAIPYFTEYTREENQIKFKVELSDYDVRNYYGLIKSENEIEVMYTREPRDLDTDSEKMIFKKVEN